MKLIALPMAAALLLVALALPAQTEAAPMISAAKAKRIALQFAPPRSRAVEVTPPEVRAQRTRAYYVHYGRTAQEQLYQTPIVGHSALVNSTNQAIMSFYLDGQIVFQTGGNLDSITSWPLTRDGQVLSGEDPLVRRFFDIVAALKAPDARRIMQGDDSLLPGDDLTSPPGAEMADSYEGPEAPRSGPSSDPAQIAGYMSAGERIVSAALRTTWIRETCGDNCGSQIFRLTGNNRWKWCAAWATWIVRSAGGDVVRQVSVEKIARWAENRGRYTSVGRPGYLAVFRGYSHIGIVRYIDRRGNVATIEGNTPVKTGRRAGYGPDGVATKTRPRSSIIGFVRTWY